MEYGFSGLLVRVSPAVVGVAEVAAGALGDEFADFGGEGHAEGGVMFELVEELFRFHGRGPGAVAVGSGHLVGGDHGVVDGAGDAYAASGVVFLALGEAQRDGDARWGGTRRDRRNSGYCAFAASFGCCWRGSSSWAFCGASLVRQVGLSLLWGSV